MAVKVKDLAAMLNLSPSTVSLVLNNRPGISEATRSRVRDALKELGYGDLLEEESVKKNIIFIVYRRRNAAQDNSPYFSQIFSEIIEGVESQIKARGYNLLVTYVDKESAAEAAAAIDREQAEGVLILATEMQEEQLDAFVRVPVPVVIVDNYVGSMKFDCITINNEQGVGEVVKYFAEMGHRDIGYLHIADNANNFAERYYGFRRAMDGFGLAWAEGRIVNIRTEDGEDIYRLLKRELSAMDPMPTAFFADNDLMALGSMKAFQEKGYRIPEDISIIGFDDLPFSEISNPALTTLRVPNTEMGQLAVRRMVDMIKKKDLINVKIQVCTKFIIRDTVRDLNK